jgi:hypothetical protein
VSRTAITITENDLRVQKPTKAVIATLIIPLPYCRCVVAWELTHGLQSYLPVMLLDAVCVMVLTEPIRNTHPDSQRTSRAPVHPALARVRS